MQIDYDKDWLDSLRFEVSLSPGSGSVVEGVYKIIGLAGIGSSNVVFNATAPNGTLVAVKFPIPRFAFYIKEFPASFNGHLLYEVSRLNQKLLRLVGDPLVDLLVSEYDLLYSNIFKPLHESGVSSMDTVTWQSTRSQLMMDFILRTPGVRYRLQDWANGGSSEPKEVEWANRSLEAIDRIAKTAPDLRPEELLENPFYIWAGAVMSGFFIRDELPSAINFLRGQYGSRSEGSQVDVWLDQSWIMGNLLQDLVDSPAVTRFVEFHNLCNEMLVS